MSSLPLAADKTKQGDESRPVFLSGRFCFLKQNQACPECEPKGRVSKEAGVR